MGARRRLTACADLIADAGGLILLGLMVLMIFGYLILSLNF